MTELNVIIWGTCNTEYSAQTCAANMQWFANNIQSACKQDIDADNALVSDAVAGEYSRHLHRHRRRAELALASSLDHPITHAFSQAFNRTASCATSVVK